ncbi:MAG: HDOD domain-containing protein [Desulfovibrio sp.]|nr:MAG: HDOD domain-containing protein [Desulfovibrio sp.]
MPEDSSTQFYTDTYFARQPVFTADKQVWGYELLYRHDEDATEASFQDKDIATLTVISNAIMTPASGHKAGKKLLINFTRESLLKEIPLALPSEATVALVDEVLASDAEALAAVENLKKEGFLIAVNSYTGDNNGEALLKLADMVFIDVLDKDQETLEAILAKAEPFSVQVAAKLVETNDQFNIANDLGFKFFQGFFFERPEIVPGRTLTSTQMSRMRLFQFIEKDSKDFDELTDIIETDVSISYRLLSFINSPAFGFSRKIESIKQAIVLLGWKQIKSWLWLVILSDIAPENKVSELHYLSSIRGKFLERAANNHNIETINAESLFLLGLFSLLEALLEIPIHDIADNLPLDDELKAALCYEENLYSPWLALAKSFERGDWAYIDQLVEKLSLDSMIVANSYAEALAWAKTFHKEA